jgi:hypothetical protein
LTTILIKEPAFMQLLHCIGKITFAHFKKNIIAKASNDVLYGRVRGKIVRTTGASLFLHTYSFFQAIKYAGLHTIGSPRAEYLFSRAQWTCIVPLIPGLKMKLKNQTVYSIGG